MRVEVGVEEDELDLQKLEHAADLRVALTGDAGGSAVAFLDLNLDRRVGIVEDVAVHLVGAILNACEAA